MCKRLRDCAIPECVRTVIPSQYLLRSNISGMSTSLGTVNAKDTRDTIHTLRRCVEGQQRAVHLKKMQTSKCVQWKSVSRSMSMYLSPFVYNFFFLIKWRKTKQKKKPHLNVALFQRGDFKPPDFQFRLYPVVREHSFSISARQLAVGMKSSTCKWMLGDEQAVGGEERVLLSVPGGCSCPQAGTLGTSVTFGVAMYSEIYNHDTLGW